VAQQAFLGNPKKLTKQLLCSGDEYKNATYCCNDWCVAPLLKCTATTHSFSSNYHLKLRRQIQSSTARTTMSDQNPDPVDLQTQSSLNVSTFIGWEPPSSAVQPGRKAPRLNHKKSRNGCQQCRARRVKVNDQVHRIFLFLLVIHHVPQVAKIMVVSVCVQCLVAKMNATKVKIIFFSKFPLAHIARIPF
jgi:hypothetical protein